MDKNERFTDQAFDKVTDRKVIEEANRRAKILKAEESTNGLPVEAKADEL